MDCKNTNSVIVSKENVKLNYTLQKLEGTDEHDDDDDDDKQDKQDKQDVSQHSYVVNSVNISEWTFNPSTDVANKARFIFFEDYSKQGGKSRLNPFQYFKKPIISTTTGTKPDYSTMSTDIKKNTSSIKLITEAEKNNNITPRTIIDEPLLNVIINTVNKTTNKNNDVVCVVTYLIYTQQYNLIYGSTFNLSTII
jgi:hypothetical protein